MEVRGAAAGGRADGTNLILTDYLNSASTETASASFIRSVDALLYSGLGLSGDVAS
jgi:hypothetical protein